MQTEKMGSYTTNFCRKKNHMILKQILVNWSVNVGVNRPQYLKRPQTMTLPPTILSHFFVYLEFNHSQRQRIVRYFPSNSIVINLLSSPKNIFSPFCVSPTNMVISEGQLIAATFCYTHKRYHIRAA